MRVHALVLTSAATNKSRVEGFPMNKSVIHALIVGNSSCLLKNFNKYLCLLLNPYHINLRSRAKAIKKILHLVSPALKQSDMNVDYIVHNSFTIEMIMTYIAREMEC